MVHNLLLHSFIVTSRQHANPFFRFDDFFVRPTLHQVNYKFTFPFVDLPKKIGPFRKDADWTPDEDHLWNRITRFGKQSDDVYFTVMSEPRLYDTPAMIRVNRNGVNPTVDAYDDIARLTERVLGVHVFFHSVELAVDWINPPWGKESYFQFRFVSWNLRCSRFVKKTLYIGSQEGPLEICLYDRGTYKKLPHNWDRIEFRIKLVRHRKAIFKTLREFIDSGQLKTRTWGRMTILKKSVLKMGLENGQKEEAKIGGAQAVFRVLKKPHLSRRMNESIVDNFLYENADPDMTSLLNKAIDFLIKQLCSHPEGLSQPIIIRPWDL